MTTRTETASRRPTPDDLLLYGDCLTVAAYIFLVGATGVLLAVRYGGRLSVMTALLFAYLLIVVGLSVLLRAGAIRSKWQQESPEGFQ